MLTALRYIARHGRACLVAGLLAGLLLPQAAQALRPWLPELVGLLIFFAALRIGPRQALGQIGDLRETLTIVLVFQVALPLAAFAVAWVLGLWTIPFVVAVVLMLSAPSVTGAPNFTILLGKNPAPAMRLLIVGTALFPLTVLPMLWLAPGLGSVSEVLFAGMRVLLTILGATSLGFIFRSLFLSDLTSDGMQALDGAGAIALAITVVGLMSAIGPTLDNEPLVLAAWFIGVMAVNLGMQAACFLVLRNKPAAVPISIVAGNRNVALFLLALPPDITDPLLIFIGCYQFPMYLTPILMRRLYATSRDDDPARSR